MCKEALEYRIRLCTKYKIQENQWNDKKICIFHLFIKLNRDWTGVTNFVSASIDAVPWKWHHQNPFLSTWICFKGKNDKKGFAPWAGKVIATRLVKIKTIMVFTLPLFYPDKNIFPFGGFQEKKKKLSKVNRKLDISWKRLWQKMLIAASYSFEG